MREGECEFLRAAITNYHKLGGLKQWIFILSQFGRLEESRYQWGYTSSEGFTEESFLASSFSKRAPKHSLVCDNVIQPLPTSIFT